MTQNEVNQALAGRIAYLQQQQARRAARRSRQSATRNKMNARMQARARARVEVESVLWQDGAGAVPVLAVEVEAAREWQDGAGAAFMAGRAARARVERDTARSERAARGVAELARARARHDRARLNDWLTGRVSYDLTRAAILARPWRARPDLRALALDLVCLGERGQSAPSGGARRARVPAMTRVFDLQAPCAALARVLAGRVSDLRVLARVLAQVESDSAAGFILTDIVPDPSHVYPSNQGFVLADTPALAGDMARDFRVDYAAWWRGAADNTLRFAGVLADCGERAARRAAGKFGRVSSTSIDEAGAAGRAAVIRFCAPAVFGSVGNVMAGYQCFRVPYGFDRAPWQREARRVAAIAGVQSLLGDLTSGQQGETTALFGLRRAAVDSLDNMTRGGVDSGAASVRDTWIEDDYLFALARRFESLPGPERELLRAGRARALDMMLAVRRARAARLSQAPGRGGRVHDDKGHLTEDKARALRVHADGSLTVERRARGWQARLALIVRRFARVARVLSAICQGDSLELACQGAGFGFERREGRSRAFSKALVETGVHALIVPQGAARRASV